jgi:hypothetical protein
MEKEPNATLFCAGNALMCVQGGTEEPWTMVGGM